MCTLYCFFSSFNFYRRFSVQQHRTMMRTLTAPILGRGFSIFIWYFLIFSPYLTVYVHTWAIHTCDVYFHPFLRVFNSILYMFFQCFCSFVIETRKKAYNWCFFLWFSLNWNSKLVSVYTHVHTDELTRKSGYPALFLSVHRNGRHVIPPWKRKKNPAAT